MDFLSKNFPELRGEIDGSIILGVQGARGEPGPPGPRGPQGNPFTFADFTPEQLEMLKVTPVLGVDYWTEDDQEKIVADVLEDIKLNVVNYDLVAMGLPNIVINGESQKLEMDTTEISNNYDKSFIVLNLNLEYRGLVFSGVKATFSPNCNVANISVFGILVYVSLFINDGFVTVRADIYSDNNGGSLDEYVEGETLVFTESSNSSIENETLIL